MTKLTHQLYKEVEEKVWSELIVQLEIYNLLGFPAAYFEEETPLMEVFPVKEVPRDPEFLEKLGIPVYYEGISLDALEKAIRNTHLKLIDHYGVDIFYSHGQHQEHHLFPTLGKLKEGIMANVFEAIGVTEKITRLEERLIDVMCQSFSYHSPFEVDSFSYDMDSDMKENFGNHGGRYMYAILHVNNHFQQHENMIIDMAELENDTIFDILPTFHHAYMYCFLKLTGEYENMAELAETVELNDLEDEKPEEEDIF